MSDLTLHVGDCIEVMSGMEDNSIDSIVCDPPYGLEFMGKEWDGAEGFRRSLNKADVSRDNAFGRASRTSPEYRAGHLFQEWCEAWAREALRVLKPGGHLLAFSGSRTYHRMTCAIEDAGFEIRDQIMWVYGSGFPKSLDVSKAIDKAAGVERVVTRTGQTKAPEDSGKFDSVSSSARERRDDPATDAARQWEGWGTALKPAHEPICVARKPLIGTVAANVLAHGTGALNIDGCRVHSDYSAGYAYTVQRMAPGADQNKTGKTHQEGVAFQGQTKDGRWPANIIHDGSDDVLAQFPQAPGQLADASTSDTQRAGQNVYGMMKRGRGAEPSADSENEGAVGFKMKPGARRLDTGSAARFFYCAKASRADRNEGLDSGAAPAVETDATMRHCETADWAARNGNHHPTVKPTDLMSYLVRLVTPPGGLVLDPFMGSGSTGKACMREGFRFVGIDQSAEYVAIARARIQHEIVVLAAAAEEYCRETAQMDLFETLAL